MGLSLHPLMAPISLDRRHHWPRAASIVFT
jgi:hypothetical protein